MKRVGRIALVVFCLLGLFSLIAQQVFSSPSTIPPGLEDRPPLEKQIFIHYKKGYGKPPGPGREEKAPSCYGFLAKGAYWKVLPIDYVIDLDYSGLNQKEVTSAIEKAAQEWDGYTRPTLFGGWQIVHGATWDSDEPDGYNEFLFGNYSDPNVIAITVTWGYFSVPPAFRRIIEFDVLFDTDFVWGDAKINPEVMDLQNIATHEIGHGLGLADVYQTACSPVTMYGYSIEGETQKQTLAAPDIKGLQALYGL